MARRLFVTGTDTGVGKTLVAGAIVSAAVEAGLRVAAMKPAETGCIVDDDAPERLHAADAAHLARLASPLAPELAALVCPFRYKTPAAPESAARIDGRPPPDRATLLAAADRLAAASDLLVVEGAGGLLVPVAPDLLFADVAQALGARLVVVARTALGTINHTLLTLEAARHRGLDVAGVVFSQSQADAGPEEETAREAIARHGRVRLLGRLPFLAHPPVERAPLAALARAHLDLPSLLAAAQ